MKKYRLNLFFRIIWVVVFSAITGCLLSLKMYWLSIVALAFTAFFVYRLFSFQGRTVKDVKRFIEAIRFSEFNISFEGFIPKGLYPEAVPQLENAIERFRLKQKKMETEQNFYDTILKRIDFGVIIIDTSRKVKWINKAALNILGKPQPRQLDDLKNVSPDLPETIDKMIPRETKIIKIEREKKQRQLAITSVIFTAEGKEMKLISLKNIESVLEESESDAWKKLIRVLTHEIMNSITPIISLAETFSGLEENEENRELMPRAMQTIHRRSKGLVDFVNNYQKLTRIPTPVFAEFQIAEMMDDISHLMRADGLRFSCSIDDEQMTVEADRSLLEQVIINLIRNACEATQQKSNPQVNIHISKSQYQRPVIRISDNGQGILPEVMDKIFVPFFTTKPAGSGIGLSICRQIINLHGGTLTVDSEPDVGTEFTIKL